MADQGYKSGKQTTFNEIENSKAISSMGNEHRELFCKANCRSEVETR